MSKADERRAFIELMTGPSDQFKAEVWREHAIRLAKRVDQLETAISDLHRVWFTGPDLDRNAISQQCLALFAATHTPDKGA